MVPTRLHFVASFTDAWIETCIDRKEYWKENVASFTDAWIETDNKDLFYYLVFVASFTDAWIETQPSTAEETLEIGRIFYRCVD